MRLLFCQPVSFVSVDIECQANNVWSSLKHLGTHDSSEFVPFAVSLLCLLMVGTIMSLHAVLSLRATWHEAHLSVDSSCFCDRCRSAAQLIVAVSVEKQRGILVFYFHLCCVVTRVRLVS